MHRKKLKWTKESFYSFINFSSILQTVYSLFAFKRKEFMKMPRVASEELQAPLAKKEKVVGC